MGRVRLLAASALCLTLTVACNFQLPGRGWQDSLSANDILTAGVNADSSIHSVRLLGDGVDTQNERVQVDVTADGAGGATGKLTLAGVQVSFVVVGTHVYLRGHDFFQRIGAPPIDLAQIDDKWVDLTGGASQLTQSFINAADISTLRDCSLKPTHGTLTKHGTTTIDGHSVVEIDDKGDKPGSTKGARYYVETDSPHFLIRLEGKTAANSGGPTRAAKCGPNDQSVGDGRLDLQQINSVPRVKAPGGALNPRTLQPEKK